MDIQLHYSCQPTAKHLPLKNILCLGLFLVQQQSFVPMMSGI